MSSFKYSKQMVIEMKVPSKEITFIVKNNNGSKLIWDVTLPDKVELSSEDIGKALGEFISKKYNVFGLECTLLSSALPGDLETP